MEGIKKVDVEFIRDPFMIESNRRQGIMSKDSTSLGDDDKVFIIDVVPLPMGTTRIIKLPLNYTVNEDYELLLLSDGTFRWDLLGFQVGDVIVTTVSGITNSYYVVSATASILILQHITTVPSGTGNAVFEIQYPITAAEYQNHTNEGFDLIENVLEGDNYSNLKYTINT